MFRVKCYGKLSSFPATEPWHPIGKTSYLYETLASCNKGRNYHKGGAKDWIANFGKNQFPRFRIVCEEYQNNTWVVIEDFQV